MSNFSGAFGNEFPSHKGEARSDQCRIHSPATRQDLHTVTYDLVRDMPTTEVIMTSKQDSLHCMYKVKLATLVYKIFHDCTPPSMGHILTKKTSPIHRLRTMNGIP